MSDYSTADYWGVIETITSPVRFFLDRYYKIEHYSTEADIKIDKVTEDITLMAPFVLPMAVANSNKSGGFKTETFTPAYVKDKDFLRPSQNVTRLAGEPLMGSLTPDQRTERRRVEIVAKHKKTIEARLEWMAAMVTLHDEVEIGGENYPTVKVKFGRNASHEIIITNPDDMWSNPSANLKKQLEDTSAKIHGATGFAATDVLMSQETWTHVRENQGIIDDANHRRGIQDSDIPSLAPSADTGVSYKGRYGEFDIYVHHGKYKDDDGTMKPYVEDGYVHQLAPVGSDGKSGLHGIQAFGRIEDFDADEGLYKIFTKDWRDKEPSAETILSQSAPFIIPGRPNAATKTKVY